MKTFNRTQTAEILGVPIRTLNRWLKQLEMNEQQTFSRDDINKYLRPCQAYLKKGKTFEEIKEIMAQRKSQKDISPEEGIPLEGSYDDFYSSELDRDIPPPPADTLAPVKEGVLALMEAYTDEIAATVADALPLMFLNSLSKKGKEGRIRAAFQQQINSINLFERTNPAGLPQDGFEDWSLDEEEESNGSIVPISENSDNGQQIVSPPEPEQ